MGKKKCMYSLCVNFDPKAKEYCCNGCYFDHNDHLKIYGEDKDTKDTTTLEMVFCLKAAEKIVPSNIRVKKVWIKTLTTMKEAIRFQKENDLNAMITCLEALEKIVPSGRGVKRVWFKALVSIREAIKLQEEIDNN